jgi:hypothetical protein
MILLRPEPPHRVRRPVQATDPTGREAFLVSLDRLSLADVEASLWPPWLTPLGADASAPPLRSGGYHSPSNRRKLPRTSHDDDMLPVGNPAPPGA